jgi:protocatechuate 3,4-dioxygenase beta subunit
MMTRILALLFIPLAAYASPSRMKIAADSEPGQRLIITGHVFGADGKPRRVQLYAYHTDAEGLYRRDGSFKGEPRLRGTLLTAEDGSYEIDTIKPAPYPHRDIPAHIHVHLRGPGFDQEEEIRFEGNGPAICHIVQGRCTVDFRLRR